MCILHMFSQKRIFKDLILGIDCWFRKIGQWPISEVADQMIAMLRMSEKPKGRDAGDLIFRKLSKQKRESRKKMIKIESSVAIRKKWLFPLLGVRFAQSDGTVLTYIRKQIIDLDRATPEELCKCYGTPECVWVWLLGNHAVLMDGGQGLTDGGLIKSFRAVTYGALINLSTKF